MAITITYDARLNTNKSLNSAAARGKKIVAGEFDLASSYATGGLAATLPGFANVDLVLIDPASGYQFVYDYTNTKIKILEPGGATATATISVGGNAAQELATNTVVSGFSALKFVAFGD
jgi:hypothetical protein